MCAFCALVTDESHWSEEGTNAAQSYLQAGRARMMDRHRRVSLVNRALNFHGCKRFYWNNKSYILRGQRVQTVIVKTLPQILARAEEISKKSADPLDPKFLEVLSKGN